MTDADRLAVIELLRELARSCVRRTEVDEQIASNDERLSLGDDLCRPNTDRDASDLRVSAAAFETRTALGLPTDAFEEPESTVPA